MFKKVLISVLAFALLVSSVLGMTSCSSDDPAETSTPATSAPAEVTEPASFGWTKTLDLAGTGVEKLGVPAVTGDPTSIKIGVILVGDETEGYTKAHMDGIKAAATKLGISDDQIVWKYGIAETNAVEDAADQLYSSGCRLIFSNSYGHQDYTLESAKKYPDAHFVALTGDTAAANVEKNIVSNFSNAFTDVYESRYVSGVVAGLKLKELVDSGELTVEKHPDSFTAEGNIKVGYVGAFSYAEVMSGYTAFFLGIKSVIQNVSMEVYYTKSWFDFDAEKSAAENFISRGCVIVGQHADSAGAPTAVETAYNAGKLVFSVGYNVDMLDAAPNAALTSASNHWAAYYEYAFATVINGGKIATNWAGGYNLDAVGITALGPKCAAGTEAAVNEVIAKIKDGSLHVFDTSKFTYKGKNLTWAFATDTNADFTADANNVIKDGYFHESYVQSAPAFSILVDGITELNTGY